MRRDFRVGRPEVIELPAPCHLEILDVVAVDEIDWRSNRCFHSPQNRMAIGPSLAPFWAASGRTSKHSGNQQHTGTRFELIATFFSPLDWP